MASTTFVDRETLIEASWLNDVNAVVYTPGTQTAADIANVPAGSIAATDVQAALNELDGDIQTKQPLDATLTAVAALDTTAGLVEQTGADTFTKTPVSVFIKSLLDDADAATARATLGSEPTLLAELTTTALATSVEFTGLDINAHKGYRIEIEYLNGTATSHLISMYVNGLTTATDYYREYLSAEGATVAAGNVNDGGIAGVGASERALAGVDLALLPGDIAYADSSITRDSGTSLKRHWYSWIRTAAVANITSLTFTAGVADGIGIGTTIKIYRKDK